MKVSVFKSAVQGAIAAVTFASALMTVGCNSESDVVISKSGVYLIELNGKGKVVLIADGMEPAVEVGKVEVLPNGVASTLYEVRTPRCGMYRWVVAAGQSINLQGDGDVKDATCPIDTIMLDNSQFNVVHGDPDRVVIKR